MQFIPTFTLPIDASGVTSEPWPTDIVALPNGASALVWTDDDNAGILLQLFDNTGTATGSPIDVTNTGQSANRPAIAVLENGNIVVAFTDLSTSSASITAQIFDDSGTPVGAQISLFTPTSGVSVRPILLPLPDGGFVMVHENTSMDGDNFGVFAQVVNADGSLRGSFFQVNETTTSFQSGAKLANLDDGGFAITWNSRNVDGSFDAVMVRTYDADGTPRISETQVNQFSAGRQTDPDVTTLADGRLLVIWESEDQDGDGDGIFARFVSAAGVPEGDEFQINSVTANDQGAPSVAATPDGGFVVLWQNVLTSSSTDIRWRQYDSTGTAISDEEVFASGPENISVFPRIDIDDNGVASITWLNLDQNSGVGSVFVAFSGRPITGTTGNDTLNGTSDQDVISGLAGDDVIDGLGGNDSISGGGDNDSILGGFGFDTLEGGDGNDTLDGQQNADILIGGAGADSMIGAEGTDRLEGGDGNDRMFSGEGADRVFGGEGNDLIRAGTNFGTSVDGVEGGAGNDTIFGEGGYDLLIGGDGDDVIDGGNQADDLRGEAGNDTLIGGAGFDRLFGGDGDDLLQDFDGQGGLFGQNGNDTIQNGDAAVNIFAGAGNDLIEAGGGNDNITANAGFDTLNGGAGDDTLRGSFNADTFVFADGDGNDVVLDFDAFNALEKIDLSAVTAITSLADLDLASAVNGAATQSGANVVIDTGSGNSVTLLNVSLSDLDAGDFLF